MNQLLTKTEKIPHIAQQAMKREVTRLLLCNRLGWTIARYNEFQMEAGIGFIEAMLIGLPELDKQALRYSGFFWGWWRNNWHIRDKEAYHRERLTERDFYLLHTAEVFNRLHITDSFWSHLAEMVDEGIKSIKETQNK